VFFVRFLFYVIFACGICSFEVDADADMVSRVLLPVEQVIAFNSVSCVFAAAEMALKYEGIDFPQERMWEIVQKSQSSGLLTNMLGSKSLFVILSEKNRKPTFFIGTVDNLKTALKQKKPVVSYVSGNGVDHVLLITGFDDEKQKLYFFDPAMPELQEMTYEEADDSFREILYSAFIVNDGFVINEEWKLREELVNLPSINLDFEEKKDRLAKILPSVAEKPVYIQQEAFYFYENGEYEEEKLGEQEKAIEAYKLALLFSKTNPARTSILPYWNLIRLFMITGQAREAGLYLNMVISKNLFFAPFFHFGRAILSSSDKKEEAETYIASYLKSLQDLEVFPYFRQMFADDLRLILNFDGLSESNREAAEGYLERLK
jgi:tetratricopeptide (TPR) repeat protein